MSLMNPTLFDLDSRKALRPSLLLRYNLTSAGDSEVAKDLFPPVFYHHDHSDLQLELFFVKLYPYVEHSYPQTSRYETTY